jgi:hypothetical protein
MRNKTTGTVLVVALSFALLLGMIPSNEVSSAKKVCLSIKKISVTVGESKTIKVKNTQKKVTWKVLSGKNNITLKKKGKVAVTLKGKKEGTAKVQATTGKTKLACKVTVKGATTHTPPSITNTEGKDEQDVAALTQLITEQAVLGATVSGDMDSDEYTWEDGKLTKIYWTWKELSGDFDVSGCVNLTYLDCTGNDLTVLDVSENMSLTDLACPLNDLTSLDVSKNENLTKLRCYNNKLKRLNVSKNENLTYFECSLNKLTSLDVSKNKNLTELYCDNNQLTSLDVSENANLTSLYCDNNQLTSLDVGKNVNLTRLGCGVNQLTSLDVSKNVSLTEFNCYNNKLKNLDVSNNVNLTELYCDWNQLTSLDVTSNTALTELNCDKTVNVTGCDKKILTWYNGEDE